MMITPIERMKGAAVLANIGLRFLIEGLKANKVKVTKTKESESYISLNAHCLDIPVDLNLMMENQGFNNNIDKLFACKLNDKNIAYLRAVFLNPSIYGRMVSLPKRKTRSVTFLSPPDAIPFIYANVKNKNAAMQFIYGYDIFPVCEYRGSYRAYYIYTDQITGKDE